MVEIDEDMSPASVPFCSINQHSTLKATNTEVEDSGKTINFKTNDGYRFCRSEEEFTEGTHRFEIKTNYFGYCSKSISFGVSYEDDLQSHSGVYYFTNSYMYCNAYPSFTNHYNSIHTVTPPISTEGSTIAINFSFDTKLISWEIDGLQQEEFPFTTDNKPCYIVVGMFYGKCTFI